MSLLYLPHRPLSRLPLIVHVALAIAALLLVSAAGYALQERFTRHTIASQTLLADLQGQVQARKNIATKVPENPSKNFTQNLPDRSVVDETVRDMGRSAQKLGISMGSLTVGHQAANTREWGKVQLTVSVAGEFVKTKAWLGELLARYSSLAVQNLSVRPSDAQWQDWQFAFALYVKD
jgi:hypothetical protein